MKDIVSQSYITCRELPYKKEDKGLHNCEVPEGVSRRHPGDLNMKVKWQKINHMAPMDQKLSNVCTGKK